MSTHGTIAVYDKNKPENIVWLHAYSDGHPDNAFDDLKNLPKFFVDRMILAKDIQEPSIGKYWMMDQYNRGHWDSFLSVCLECWSNLVAALLVNRHLIRWRPVTRDQIDLWLRSEGSGADIDVICDGTGYTIVPCKDLLEDKDLEFDFEVVHVDFIQEVQRLIELHIDKASNLP